MKSSAFRFVLIADQVDSRTGADRVPDALAALSGVDHVLPYERTAGDEVQGLLASGSSVVRSVTALTRLEGWRIGLGAGRVEEPLPDSTRAARGDAYLAARTAIDAARRSPVGLSLAAGGVGDPAYRDLVEDAETALWLMRSTLSRRSREGWELVDLLDAGLSNAQAADRLGVSASAVSQRLRRAARTESDRAGRLASRLLDRLGEVPA
ncbi:MAG TPA: winged helix-turn-helix transcriptional regulator [Propionibacteriaceae bacterium]|nr:winged helix-turn-helix transcriptional regulator [Propionibacteriaceae bacterium]